MTGQAGPAVLPGQSRRPLSCCLEEHVRYSSPKSCSSGDEFDDPSHMPLFSQTMRTRKEVRLLLGQRAPPPHGTYAAADHVVLQDGIELFDEPSSTKVFYKTFNRESSGEEPESVQRDSQSGASSPTRADEEIVDVILSGKVGATFTFTLTFPYH
jgi:hypothetical protein